MAPRPPCRFHLYLERRTIFDYDGEEVSRRAFDQELSGQEDVGVAPASRANEDG